MARIVLGMAVPHSGMLGKPPETWHEDGLRDHTNKMLWYRNKHWQFEDLLAERRGEGLAALLTLEERQARHRRNQDAIAELRRVYAELKPDIAVIIGKDQREIFIDTTPSLAVYTGETVENGPPGRSVYAPDHPVSYDACPDLALHLIKEVSQAGFDLTEIVKWPPNVWLQNSQVVPHAFGFIYHQIMQDRPPPSVPILMNTFYPPTQPSMRRSIQFGEALYKAISSWDADKTVAVIASGGLSHFVCDEQLDRRLISYFRQFDFDALANVDDRSYQSGTSEVKIYVPMLVCMSKLQLDMTLVDYVPTYRTEAGTGEGMGFMYWTPRA